VNSRPRFLDRPRGFSGIAFRANIFLKYFQCLNEVDTGPLFKGQNCEPSLVEPICQSRPCSIPIEWPTGSDLDASEDYKEWKGESLEAPAGSLVAALFGWRAPRDGRREFAPLSRLVAQAPDTRLLIGLALTTKTIDWIRTICLRAGSSASVIVVSSSPSSLDDVIRSLFGPFMDLKNVVSR